MSKEGFLICILTQSPQVLYPISSTNDIIMRYDMIKAFTIRGFFLPESETVLGKGSVQISRTNVDSVGVHSIQWYARENHACFIRLNTKT